MKDKVIKYPHPNGEITVEWRPELCQHAGVCFGTLPLVYRPSDRPWIRPQFATTQELIDQINNCPSGALQYTLNK